MKKYQVIQCDDQNKVKEHLIIYRVVKKGREYNFCFRLLDHAGFMNMRGGELNELINDAIKEEPQEQYFEYTGSHFEPGSNPFWLKLPWDKMK